MPGVIERLTEWLVHHRWYVLAGLLVVTAVAVPIAARVGVDNGVDVWFVSGDPAIAAYHDFQETFGNDETIVVGVELPDGVFTPDGLNLVRELSTRIAAVPGVRRTLDITSVKTITPTATALDVRALVDGPVPDAAAAAAVRARYDDDPLLHAGLVADDGRTAVVIAQMAAMDDIDAKRDEVITAVERILDELVAAKGLRFHVAGIGVIYNSLNRISQGEGALFVGLSQLLIFVLLLLLFRRVGPVVLSLLVVGMATIWLLALYALAGRTINMVTMVLPTLVLVLGVSDSVHILRHTAHEGSRGLAADLADIARPCLFNSLTMMAGFAALGVSQMAVVRDLGWFAAIGIGLAFVTTYLLATVALPGRFARPRPESHDRVAQWLRGLLARTTDFALRHRGPVVAVTALGMLGASVGIMRVEVDTYSLGFLPDDHPTRRATDALEERLGPFTPLEFVVDTKASEGLKDPVVLKGLAAWQAELEKDPRVRTTLSLADVSARLHAVLSGEPAAVPDDADQLWQGLELYGQDPDNDRVHLADASYRLGRMTAAVPVLSSEGYRQLIDDALAIAKRTMPAAVEVRPAGYLPLYVRMMDYIVDSQVDSFALSVLLVVGLVGLLFRSVPIAAFAIPPNLLPVIAMLGIMGFLGIALDVATVTIAAIITGITMDDTIHFLYRYRIELRNNGGDHEAAARSSMSLAGPAMLASMLVLACGFLVFLGAGVKSIAYFGLLSGVALGVGIIGDLFMMPALLALLRPKL